MNDILGSLEKGDFEKLQGLLNMFASMQNNPVITLRVFCEEYEDYIKKNRSKAYYTSVSISLNHLTDYFGIHNPISTVTLKEAEQFMTNLQQDVKKGYKVYYRNLKAAFNKAKRWGYISNNPFEQITLKKEQKTHPLFIDETTLNNIVDSIENETVKDAVVTAYYTGMRLNEIVNLRWKNVDLEKRMITVGDEKFTTKSRNQRYVPVCGRLEKGLKNRVIKGCHLLSFSSHLSRENNRKIENQSIVVGRIEQVKNESGEKDDAELIRNEFVFSKSNGQRFTGDHFSKKFKKACRDAGVDERIHFHTLRHSFASRLAQEGVSLYVIKELLGHSSITTTEIYSHLNVESLREAIEKLNQKAPSPVETEFHQDSSEYIEDIK